MTDMRPPSKLRVVAVGPLPPPPGGIASSLKNLLEATKDRDDIAAEVIQWKEMWRLLLHRPDVLHLHFSTPVKRLIGALIGRVIGVRVVQTIHSNNYDFSKFGNRWAARLTHGSIVLNTSIQDRFRAEGIANSVLMTPILASHRRHEIESVLDPALKRWLSERRGKVAVVYSHDRREIDGHDIYGFSFVSSLLPRLHEIGWNVIFLDPFAFYRAEELFPVDCPNAWLQSSYVNFELLLGCIHVYLRPTATDGSSVAVLEALASGTPVIASDIVPRPLGVQTYRFRDAEAFLDLLNRLDKHRQDVGSPSLTSTDEYVKFLSGLVS